MRAFLLAASTAAFLAACGGGKSPSSTAAPASFHLEEATIEQIQSAITRKQLTSTQLVELYLKRIKAYNGTCVEEPEGRLGKIKTIPNAGQINALSTLNLRPATLKQWGFDERKARSMTDTVDADPKMPDALETAARLDAEFAKTGKLVGPLHGVVIAIKDQYDTFDMRTTSGGDAPWANDRPPDDATFVQRLRDAGAIIIAKSNLAEYASGGARSAFGGTFCNPYDTERSPNASSAGSGTAVAANLVTCGIAEETSSSIRGPAVAANAVGLAGTQELVSRDGMIGAGIHTRTGPICRTVQDTAKVFDVIAGYDPKDEMTAFAVGHLPPQPYASYAVNGKLDGLRIGVLREYMNRTLFTQADEAGITLVEKGIEDLKKLGATIVDPGPEGALFQTCVDRFNPMLRNSTYIKANADLFPMKDGKPVGDQTAMLLDLYFDPSKAPQGITIRNLGNVRAEGEGKYMLNKYLRERGDANITSNADIIAKGTYYNDPNFPDRKKARENAEAATTLDTAARLQQRYAVQQMVMACMAEQKLDAVVYPTSNLPPPKLAGPAEPAKNGRSNVWTFLGQQGFPAITVPAGFTTEIYDRELDPDAPPEAAGPPEGESAMPRVPTKLVGPIAKKLPIGIDFLGRPYSEPTLLRIAAAYEAATQHRVPPKGFGPLEGEP